MAGFIQDLLQGATGTIFGSDYLRDYTHASKTFRTNSYQYAPKLKFLFHVYFDINSDAYPYNVGTGNNFGLAVKTIKLPSFNFETQVMNQYNRKRINQTKIKYDPIEVAFHDDNGNIISKMWQAYYTYYYNDGNKPQVQFAGTPGSNLGTKLAGGGVQATATLADYNSRNQYNPSITGNADWGYVGEGSKLSSNGFNSVKIPFFKSITVFGFNQHNFSAYTLINPVITRFGHDTYNYAEGNGTMENQMTLDYETVVYNTGALSGKSPSSIVTGFGEQANYDTTTSPIAKPGSNQTILGQGGLVDGASGVINGLEQGGISGFLGAAVAAGTTYNTFKNANLKTIAQSEVTTAIVNNGINGFPNRNLNVLTPIFGSTPSTSGTGGSQGQSAPTPVGPNNAGKQTGS